ncbi:hypothetical protein [Enterobacter hormaechei]|uniref:hypothetical protein n=1 Tax=Enterobacter hormaechei TaxID=158836 RepID=UPI0005DBC08A|nr:hypothetical protein [Enterobacter hormaechei]CQR76116.1 hypothetical protein BN1385_00939 [Enterobacter hormaechei]
MTKQKITQPTTGHDDNSDEGSSEKKTCFVIMPIADHPDYTPGHFTRVYEHLIKPACEAAGFKERRADDPKASHMIMFDILKNIVECDMAICDLSSKNANVFYELGLRQAFNKKTILITDGLTNTPFDISGFRYVKYSESLRVDTVKNDILEISAMLKETESASEEDINSIVNLLKIQPAEVNKIQLNDQESVLYELIKNLDAKITSLSSNGASEYISKTDKKHVPSTRKSLGLFSGKTFEELFAMDKTVMKNYTFYEGDTYLGEYVGVNEDGELVFRSGRTQYNCPNTAAYRSSIKAV